MNSDLDNIYIIFVYTSINLDALQVRRHQHWTEGV